MKNLDKLIYGRNSVKEAILSGQVTKLFISNSIRKCEISDLATAKNIPITYLGFPEMDNMIPNAVHQGVIAEIKKYEYFTLDHILSLSKKVEHPIIVLLDGITDPQNFGAILRSCDVFNVTGVIIPKHQQVPLNATVAKTSAGAINYVPVVLVSNLNNAIRTLKENGFWVVSTDGAGTMNYFDISYDFPTALIIGSEGNGISQLTLKNSDYIVKIPLLGHLNSLNASVAAGILLSRIRNK
ncbi:MAG: 23S rRNA (guanosine(2251)-2'-O)-methyltransferase RlmB [Bacilli bacterium]|jgi:23S rRNA (guanosine2251-2'-O)-methyltransferase|nr:23S rRNA (guanosine(2251)-2'-O)-methyltransferase RlmB [Bacilli bacterium]MDD3069105.1 23S rRNA (guanosine(2251)-2'-O)-methyltransferase RlmB [Bacilli bacterium]MDD3841445.1 23S rRNA (guanosine(2251)-2'-O)-methyltransferase RlmB [Bacilli bacterium]HKM10679.1 23S rRNA (guanosine(2251)-2'-O)-methyltransferase RlmB [Bacilli bacterium]